MSEKQKREILALKGEIAEKQRFLERQQRLTKGAHEAFQRVMSEHTPYVHMNTSMDRPLTDGKMVLRCTVCKTREHHTWGPFNDVLWPCPTVQAILDPQVYGDGGDDEAVEDAPDAQQAGAACEG